MATKETLAIRLSIEVLAALTALGEIESGNDDLAIGAAGEITRYQILPNIWKLYDPDMSRTSDVNYAGEITVKILQHRHGKFTEAMKRQPNTKELYALWNAPGIFANIGYDYDRLPAIIKDRCERFGNLVDHYMTVLEKGTSIK